VTRTADDVTILACEDVQSCILPTCGPVGPASKLTVFFEFKCDWSGSTDIGEDRALLEISGNAGTASATRNRVRIWYDLANTRLEAQLRDDADADHEMRDATVYDYSEWHSVRAVFDFSDLSRIDMWVDGDNSAVTYNGNTGTADFDTDDVSIKLGQEYDGTVNGNCSIKNLRLTAQEIRP